jgi:hypothetical protein
MSQHVVDGQWETVLEAVRGMVRNGATPSCGKAMLLAGDVNPQVAREQWQLLDRMLYKSKNAHKSTRYFQYLREVQRCFRRIEVLVLIPSGDAVEATMEMSTLHLLMDHTIAACERAYAALRELASRKFFLPFTLVSMAVVAKLAEQLRIVSRELMRLRGMRVEMDSKVIVAKSTAGDDVGGMFSKMMWYLLE